MDSFLEGNPVTDMLVLLVAVLLPLFLLWQTVSSAGYIYFAHRALSRGLVDFQRVGFVTVMVRAVLVTFSTALVIVPLAAAFFFAARFLAGLVYDGLLASRLTLPGAALLLLVALVFAAALMLVDNVFSLAVAAAIFEERLMFGAMLRSWQLIRADFWAVFFARMLWHFVTIGFAAAALGLVFVLAGLVRMAAGALPPHLAVIFLPIGVIAAGFTLFVSFAQMPMDGVMRAVVYFNQRLKTDGWDIEIRLQWLARRKQAENGPA